MVDFTGGTWRSLIDGEEIAAIPDSGIVHDWDATDDSQITQSNGTVTAIDDAVGSLELTGDATGLTDINGVQAIDFDGADDALTGDSPLNFGSDYSFHLVVEFSDTQQRSIFESEDGDGLRVEIDGSGSDDGRIVHQGENNMGYYEPDTEPYLLSVRYDDTDDDVPDVRINDGEQTTETTSTTMHDPDGDMELGSGTRDNFFGAFGRLRVYNEKQSDEDFNETISILMDLFNID